MKKYYYIDENGNKKNYMGKVINDYITNNTYGIISYQESEEKEIELLFNNEIPYKPKQNPYFAYIDKNGDVQKYTGLKNNIINNDNSYFFNQVITEKIDLKYYPKVEYIPKKFTYIDKEGIEQEYKGKYFFDKFTSSYYFYKTK